MSEPLPMAPPNAESHGIAAWAAARGLRFDATPDEAWFRAWEPFDTMAAPARYLNGVTQVNPDGLIVLAEPWMADEGMEPLGRTVLGFVTHPALCGRAAGRAGEHFNTRVVFLDGRAPVAVSTGDALWDAHVATFAESTEVARRALRSRLRDHLAQSGFDGHVEVRTGGLVLHLAGLPPHVDGYRRLRRAMMALRGVMSGLANAV